MPLYDYQCKQCKTVREVRHGFRETTTEVCGVCGGELQRVFNPAGIVFKGSGFYINDSRPKPSGESSSSSSDAAPAKKADSAA